jgi:transposase
VYRVRETKTGSGKIAVQVVLRRYHRTEVIKHLGSGDEEEEISRLKILARQFIREREKLIPLFSDIGKEESSNLISPKNIEVPNYYHQFAYDYLLKFYRLNGFNKIKSEILKDLVLIRVIEPVSKLRSLALLKEHFGKIYSPSTFYKNIGKLTEFKEQAEKLAVSYARKHLKFDFSIVFYDVTTLYFETFSDDKFRKYGFSKDNKSSQPQILVALVVNSDGYPIAAEIFEGNKFEGHTIIPVVLAFQARNKIKNLTVVADAAMLSRDNMEELSRNNLSYIVGARLSSIPNKILEQVSQCIAGKQGIYFKLKTDFGYLICDFSELRALKDRTDRKRQILRSQKQIRDPGKFMKRSKYVKEITKSVYEMNEELIRKNEMLDGIKGYYTNLEGVDSNLIVSRYHDLWKIEKSFRIAKSDLLARPVFHRKKESIAAHILIVFLALCVAKSIELKTNLSIKSVKEKIWRVLDVEIKDKTTGKSFIKRTPAPVLEY